MNVGSSRMRRLAIPLVIAALAGCRRTHEGVPPPGQPASLPLFRPTIGDRESIPAIVRANNAFALALYQRLQTRPGNLLVSPACLSAGLALMHTGARGETAQQIARVLHLPDGLTQADNAYAALVQDLNADAEDRSYQIRLANAVWVQDGYPLLDSYRAALKEAFALDVNRVDFSGRPDEACRVVNAWTESRTSGKIAGMLRPADLPPQTRLALTNALYLRASWTKRFRKECTRPEAFHVGPGENVEVPMMNAHSYAVVHGFFDGGSFQALELPCGSGGEFAMVVLLPRENDGLAALEAALTPEALESWCASFRRPEEIVIALPKYQIRADVVLNQLLSELGMPLAFDSQADFSGINGKSRDLFLSAARHATLLEVHEEGITAAAAMDILNPDAFGEPSVFRADHPFVFLIRDTRSGCIIFLGRVANPLQHSYQVSTSEGLVNN